MSIKDIITVPDETLKKISEPLEKVSANEKKLIDVLTDDVTENILNTIVLKLDDL